ncbi:MAG: stage V sporulation protein B [Cellulosilyticaceae bacterium]
MGKKALITGTLILTGASLITRLLGFIFRIYMSNIMGAEGIGLYQLIFPIYMLTWSLCSAGVSLAVSKKVAELSAKRLYQDAIRTLKCAIVLSVSIALAVAVPLFIFAPFIANHFIHEPNTAIALRLLPFCLPFMATACCIRGYFQGRQEMLIPATAQIVEQVARMIVIALFSSFFIPKGLAYACALGMLGLCGGEFCSCFFTFTMYKFKKRSLVLRPAITPYNEVFATLLAISIPITANRFLTSMLQSVENILIPLQLQKFGLPSSEALGLYGMFSGMALPLLFFPSMVTTSIATALVPAISEASATKNQKTLKYTVSKSIQFSMLIGIGASSLFYTLGPEIGMACYKLPEVGEILKILAIICPFLYLQGILNGILNGLGLQRLTFKSTLIGSAICISLILLLVPQKGIIGFAIAMLLQSGFMTIYNLFHILKHISLPVDIMGWILRPSIAALFGCISMKYVHNHILLSQFSMTFSTVIAVSLLGIFYISYLFIFKCITLDDIKTILPF